MKELSKARVTVSMDRELWARGKVRSHDLHISFSGYLERLIERDISGGGDSQLDRVEGKIDLLLGDRPPGEKISRGDMIRPDDEEIKEAQEKLENIQKSRGYFNPQPKGKK